MKFALISSVTILLGISASLNGHRPALKAEPKVLVYGSELSSASCGCSDSTALANRLKGVEAAIRLLTSRAQGPSASGAFDENTFDQNIGDSLTETLVTNGGLNAIVIADIDRNTCDINTGANLTNVPGMPAGIGGSACLQESAAAQLNVRRQACMAGRNSSNEGNDYWQGRQMSDVIRELTESYRTEARFLKNQITSLAPLCKTAARKPTKDLCENCVHYMFDAKRTLPFVGTIRMWADEMIPFDVNPDRTISGWGTINTVLDTSGSPCRFSGYNGAADFNIAGRISGGNLNVTLTPRGASQRISAAMSITCPPKGEAHTYPQSQTYTINEVLKVPVAGQQFTEKRLDVGTLTRGAMDGEIILRLSMKPLR